MRIRNWQSGLTVTSPFALFFFPHASRLNRCRSSISSGGPEGGFSLVGNPIQGLGPTDPYQGFPRCYQDSTGVRVELCHDVDARCVAPQHAAKFENGGN